MQLIVTMSDGGKQTVSLAEGQTSIIGRGKQATIPIPDTSVSRKHCQLEWIDNDCVLTDLKSSGGTFVNGVSIDRHVLKPGDVVTVGDTSFTIVEDEVPSAVTIKPVRKAAEPQSAQSLPQLVGSVIHHYKIEKLESEDSDNGIFLGRNLKSQKAVAIKVLCPKPWEDDVRRRRFIRGVMSLRGIEHPNLVRLYSAGQCGEMCWLAMEYVPGENLRQIIDRLGAAGRLDWQLAFRVALDIGRALTAAEAAEVVHRNITPRSILRRNDGVYKLTGLTLAKARHSETSEEITKRGECVGELPYLPPELISDGGDADTRSDLYGLGATLYRLLTGRFPYMATNLAQLLKEMAAGDPPRPKKFQLSVSDAMEGLVMQLIAQSPEDRFQSANDLVRDLERIGKFSGLSTAQSS